MPETLSLALPFFAVIVCGYGAGAFGLLSEGGAAGLDAFVYWFALPALLFQLMAATPANELLDPAFLAAWIGAGLAVFALACAVARLVLREPLADAGMIGFAASFGNLGYLGLPLILAAVGQVAATPLVLGLLIDSTLFVALAVALVEFGRTGRGALARAGLRIALALLRNPMILGALAGIAATLLDLALPVALLGFTHLLGAAAGPAALFALGATLAGRPAARDLGDAGLVLAVKLLLHPPAMYAAAVLLLPVDPQWARTMVLAAALPVGGAAFVLARELGVKASAISTAVLLSTGVSMATLTLLLARLGSF